MVLACSADGAAAGDALAAGEVNVVVTGDPGAPGAPGDIPGAAGAAPGCCGAGAAGFAGAALAGAPGAAGAAAVAAGGAPGGGAGGGFCGFWPNALKAMAEMQIVSNVFIVAAEFPFPARFPVTAFPFIPKGFVSSPAKLFTF